MAFQIVRGNIAEIKADRVMRLDAVTDEDLRQAWKHGCRTIALSLTTDDAHEASAEAKTRVPAEIIRHFLEEHEAEIILVVSDGYADKISGRLYETVHSHLNGRTVRPCARRRVLSGSAPSIAPPQRMAMKAMPRPSMSVEGVPSFLEEKLKQTQRDSFEKRLQQLINKKGMKNSEVYAAANISKQYFSKLMKGKVKPSKEKVLALAIGLKLNMDETIDFLRVAGYALSPISERDIVVEYFIRNRDYSVIRIDIVLFDCGLPLLSE